MSLCWISWIELNKLHHNRFLTFNNNPWHPFFDDVFYPTSSNLCGVTSTQGKPKMARGQKTDLRPVKLHLSMPKELAEWVENEMEKNPYCQTRQDFIIGKLTEIMKKDSRQGVLEIS